MPAKIRTASRSGAKQQQTVRATSRARKGLKKPKNAKSPSQKPIAQSANSKIAAILNLLHRSTGASLLDLTAATGWQAHSIRGCLSGTIKKKLGLDLRSEKSGNGERRYRIVGA